jgi:crotonobetainyl-CoA:carnitine CoA-transferase CaiB-like acyl-CoA transferase
MDLYLNAGKRRLGTEDPALIAELAARADVVVAEAESAEALAALGFDAWPSPVKAAITPFGRTGPKRNTPATPHTLLAMGGYTNLMGDPDRAPLSLPGHYVEFQSGGFAFAAASACRLAEQSNSIDIGMFEVVMALSQFTTVMWHCGGVVRSRHGSDFWSVVPTNLFRCADGWVYINIVPTFWDAFAVFLERPELLIDERFASNEKRMLNRDALHGIIAEAVAPLPKAVIEERATSCRIPVGVVQSFEDVLGDAHLAGRDVWQQVDGPGRGTVRSPRQSWRVHGDVPTAFTLAEPEGAGAALG